ncbi:MarR family winged helix-turn-helix transcriptional regulator [Aureimonas sp. AU4]|uniref:MarR family winged helix-turn-helix transcriptional regulator n=1 Tax=Aureimonas sp. AU4 TaxID=1638163 RepID=UPI00178CF4F0|nr:MarR family transcriptional regulator [Aureimonas sp. AU4]
MENAFKKRAVHTSPHRNLLGSAANEATILTNALSSAQSMRVLLGLKLTPIGIVSGQDRLLLALQIHERMTVSRLAEVINVRPSTVSKMMDRLTERGLTERTSDSTDGRITNVELTDNGRAVCRKLQILCEEIESELRADLDDDEIETMTEGLRLLNEVVRRRLARLR